MMGPSPSITPSTLKSSLPKYVLRVSIVYHHPNEYPTRPRDVLRLLSPDTLHTNNNTLFLLYMYHWPLLARQGCAKGNYLATSSNFSIYCDLSINDPCANRTLWGSITNITCQAHIFESANKSHVQISSHIERVSWQGAD